MNDLDNPVVGLLDAYRPQVLDRLRRDHPRGAAVLATRGVVMGAAEDETLRHAAMAFLDNIGGIADEAASAALGRLRTARRLELAGALVAVASSAGVITALLGSAWAGSALALAIVSFVAGAIPLVTGWLRDTDGGASVAESLAAVRETNWDAQALRAHLARGGSRADLLDEVNGLARKLADALAALGFPAAVRPL